MKKYQLLLVVGTILVLIGCHNGNQTNTIDLVVMEQVDSVYGIHDEDDHYWNDYCSASFDVDVPKNGPQVIVDSVMALVNKEVYEMCEYCIDFDGIPENHVAYSEKEVFTNEGERLLSHYMDKYHSLLQDSLWNTFGLELKLETQTKKYITYGSVFIHCGANCGTKKSFYIFDKSDGHLLRDIISHENLERFFKDHPEYCTIDSDPWLGRNGWHFSSDDNAYKYDYGLLNDHFSLVIEGADPNFLHLDIPYSQIISYLSAEAQKLIEQ